MHVVHIDLIVVLMQRIENNQHLPNHYDPFGSDELTWSRLV